jgi:hypothetical protein
VTAGFPAKAWQDFDRDTVNGLHHGMWAVGVNGQANDMDDDQVDELVAVWMVQEQYVQVRYVPVRFIPVR